MACPCGTLDDLLDSASCDIDTNPGVEASWSFICKNEVTDIPAAVAGIIPTDIKIAPGAAFSLWDRLDITGKVSEAKAYKDKWISTIEITVLGRTPDALIASDVLSNNEIVAVNVDKLGQPFLYGDNVSGIKFAVAATTGVDGGTDKSSIKLTGTVSSKHPPYGYSGVY